MSQGAATAIVVDESPNDPDLGVSAIGLRRAFGSVPVLRGVDMQAKYGEVTALIGPNGAGKTTLLLVLATLLAADAGTVRVGGHDPVANPRAVRAVMGWSPDVFGVPENLTTTEYLVSAAAAHRLPKALRVTRAAELLAMVDLSEFATRQTGVLSRGQKQRLGLARALVHQPRVVLLDEPAAGLDPRARVSLRDALRGLASNGVAVVISSHVLSDLEDLADAAVIVDGGVTVATHRRGAFPTSPRPAAWRLRALNGDDLVRVLERHLISHRVLAPGTVELALAGEADAANLLAWLISERIAVASCAPVGGSLEAAYLEATS